MFFFLCALMHNNACMYASIHLYVSLQNNSHKNWDHCVITHYAVMKFRSALVK